MLRTQDIEISLAQGIETQIDSKVLDSKNLVVENASFNKFEALQKAGGYEKIPHDSEDGDLTGKIKAVLPQGNNPVVVTDDRAFHTYRPSSQSFERLPGAKFPAKVKTHDYFYQGTTQNFPSMDRKDSLTVMAYEEIDANTANLGTTDNFVRVSGYVSGTGEVFQSQAIKDAYNPRVAIVGEGGVKKVVLIYKEIVGSDYKVYMQHYDTSLNLSGARVLISEDIQDDSIISATSHNGDIYLLWKHGSSAQYPLKVIRVSYDGAVTEVDFTPSNSSIPKGVYCRIFNSELWISWRAGDSANSKVGFRTYSLDLSSTGISESYVGDSSDIYGTIRTHSFSVSSGVLHLVYDTIYDNISDNLEANLCLQVETYPVNPSGFGPLDYRGSINGAHLMSHVHIEDGKLYSLLGYSSDLQKTNFFCEIELAASGPIANVLTKGTTGIAADSYTRNSGGPVHGSWPSQMAFSYGKFFVVNEAAARFSNTYVTGIDGSAIELLEIDMEDFSYDVGVFGSSTILTAGLVLTIDASSVVECGHFLRPDKFELETVSSPGGIGSGTRGYKVLFEAYNSYGELCRSSVSQSKSVTISDDEVVKVRVIIPPFGARPYGRGKLTIYRTEDAGTVYRKIGEYEQFPTVSPLDNYGVIEFKDAFSDSVIADNEIVYTAGGELEDDAAPVAETMSISKNRIVLGGLRVGGEIGYSKTGVFKIAPTFSDFYRIQIDNTQLDAGGGVQGVAHVDDKIIVFTPSSTFYVVGDGPSNNGQNDDYSTPQNISFDVGCIEPRSIINIPDGLLFKSQKGFYFLDRALNLQYVGNSVFEFNDKAVTASLLVESKNEARFYLSEGSVLVYHYLLNEWYVLTYPALSAAAVGGHTYILREGSVFKDSGEFSRDGSFYGLKVRTPWLKLNTMQGFQRIRRAIITGEYKSPHTLTMRIYFDYDESEYEEHTIEMDSDDVYSLECHIGNQKCSSIMFEIFDNPISGGESMELNKLTLEVGIKKGTAKLSSSKRF